MYSDGVHSLSALVQEFSFQMQSSVWIQIGYEHKSTKVCESPGKSFTKTIGTAGHEDTLVLQIALSCSIVYPCISHRSVTQLLYDLI